MRSGCRPARLVVSPGSVARSYSSGVAFGRSRDVVANRLPVRRTARPGAAAALVFPVEEFVRFLSGPAEERGDDAETIDALGRPVPAISQRVGITSQNSPTNALVTPAWIFPGQRREIGVRMPPSYRSCL